MSTNQLHVPVEPLRTKEGCTGFNSSLPQWYSCSVSCDHPTGRRVGVLAPGWLTVSPVKLFIAAYSPEHCLHTNSTSCSAILWPSSATTAYDIANTSYMLLHASSLNHLYILNSIILICIVGRCDGAYWCIRLVSLTTLMLNTKNHHRHDHAFPCTALTGCFHCQWASLNNYVHIYEQKKKLSHKTSDGFTTYICLCCDITES